MNQASKEFLSNQRVLIVSPHSDDEAFGCAGTMSRIKDLGGEVYVMLMSIGDLEQFKENEDMVEMSTRKEEFVEEMEFLGVDDYDIIFEDSEKHLRLDRMSRRDLIAKIETDSKLSLQNLEPSMLLLPSISYNQDHEATFRAGFTAARPGLEGVKHMPPYVLSYDNPTHFWNVEREKFHPNFYVDISDHWETKVEALEKHDSQLRPSEHFLSLDTMLHLSKLRGREIGADAAEAYMCLRFVL